MGMLYPLKSFDPISLWFFFFFSFVWGFGGRIFVLGLLLLFGVFWVGFWFFFGSEWVALILEFYFKSLSIYQ